MSIYYNKNTSCILNISTFFSNCFNPNGTKISFNNCHNMNLSIGIFACNESASISKTLESLLKQSLFNNSSNYDLIEIIVVPNGCTDDTAEVARAKLRELIGEPEQSNIQWQVCEINQPGKSNAWNFYVHQFSDSAADFLILMDADIEFIETHTLSNMLDVFRTNKKAWVSLDRPIKDVSLKKEKNWREKLSVAVSGTSSSNSGRLYICGQLYCSPASVLRRIWLPIGLPVEDGFLTAMVVSNNFTSLSNLERIVRADSASHSFKAYLDPIDLVRHEQRIVIGIAINIFLSKYLKTICNRQFNAGSLIKQMNQQDPQWLKHFIEDNISTKRWWTLPTPLVFRRLRNLKNRSLSKALLFAPIALAAFLVDIPIFILANYKLSKGVGWNYW